MAAKRKAPARKSRRSTPRTKRSTRATRKEQRTRQAELREEKRLRRAKRREKSLGRRFFSFWWRLSKGTAKGSAKRVVKWTPVLYRAGSAKVADTYRRQRFDKDYEREDGEVPDRAWRLHTTYRCCNRRFASSEALNEHHEREHAEDEAEKAARPQPKLVISTTKRTTGHRRVKPVGDLPTGRHRPGRTNATRADVLVAAHRDKLTEIGKKAVMTESSAPNLVRQGFATIEDGPLGGLRTIENLATGMEAALAAGSEAYRAYRMKMIHAGFDPAHLQQLARIEELLKDAAQRNSAFIALIKDELGPEILAAKKRLAGERPSDAILAN